MKKRSFFWLLLLILLGYITYGIVKLSQSMVEDAGISMTIDREYQQLFNPQVQSQFSNKFTYYSKVRNPISIFEYSAYTILVYKIADVSSSYKLKAAEFIDKEVMTAGQVFNDYRRHNFNLRYHAGNFLFDNNLYLTMKKSTVEKIDEQDSIAMYYIKSNQTAFRFHRNSSNDFIVQGDPLSNEVSFLLCILKKTTSLYLFEIVLNGNGEIQNKRIIETICN